MIPQKRETLVPSDEQLMFVTRAKQGENILVDACIGSGKTTAIQKLCLSLPSSKRVLYLTYNKLLKLDALSKIRRNNVTVQNYHGFAYQALSRGGYVSGVSDLIQNVLKQKPELLPYDILIIDEYQDIDQEISEMLSYIKSTNPNMQLIAVGDMAQKIYDKTRLDVQEFIQDFLGEYTAISFTRCFRLSQQHASALGRIWGKPIIGVNQDCQVESMSRHEIIPLLAQQNVSDILCLGARNGVMSDILNVLETNYPDKFNKQTVYASIGGDHGSVSPGPSNAIFTTFDSSKGMERDICVIFDYDMPYWYSRLNRPQQKYEVLRNIFLVAASRGKKRIIFVYGDNDILDEETLMDVPFDEVEFSDMSAQELFAFKYKENVEEAFRLLNVESLNTSGELLELPMSDGLIDLSPCIAKFQMAAYFEKFDMDRYMELAHKMRFKTECPPSKYKLSLDEKILYYVSLITNQKRYRQQVTTPLVNDADRQLLQNRLSSVVPANSDVQVPVKKDFKVDGETIFTFVDFSDVVYDNKLYQFEFNTELSHESYLECAVRMVCLGLNECIVVNVYNNAQYRITVDNVEQFMNKVFETATKGAYMYCDR